MVLPGATRTGKKVWKCGGEWMQDWAEGHFANFVSWLK
jgi:hypothetical protein